MEVKIKKLVPEAILPSYSKVGDAGMDLTAISRSLVVKEGEADYIEYKTGLAVKIPDGYFGLLVPRSSNSKVDMTLCNHAGIIDSGYIGEISFRYKIDAVYDEIKLVNNAAHIYNEDTNPFKVFIHNVGDRIGQLIIMPYPQIEFKEVEELESTERGANGYGSTGK